MLTGSVKQSPTINVGEAEHVAVPHQVSS